MFSTCDSVLHVPILLLQLMDVFKYITIAAYFISREASYGFGNFYKTILDTLYCKQLLLNVTCGVHIRKDTNSRLAHQYLRRTRQRKFWNTCGNTPIVTENYHCVSVLESVQRIEDKQNQICTKHNKYAVKGWYYDDGLIIANSDLITKIDLKCYHTNHFLGEVIKRDILLALPGANILIKKDILGLFLGLFLNPHFCQTGPPLINKV